MKNFFVSYNGKDQAWAEWLAWELEAAGYSTIIQAWDFRPGGNFVLDMQRAAEEAERTIAVLSPNYLAALYTQPEWAAAFAQDPTGATKTLLPVRVQDCDLKGLLSQIVYIDLVGKTEAEARAALLAGLTPGRAKPSAAPAFPGAATDETAPPPDKPAFPPQAVETPTQPSGFQAIKRRALQDRLEALTEQYQAANHQLTTALAEQDKVILRRQLSDLEAQIAEVEAELAGL